MDGRATRGRKEEGKTCGILRRWWDGKGRQARTTRGKSQCWARRAATPQGAVTEGGATAEARRSESNTFFLFPAPADRQIGTAAAQVLHKAHGSGRGQKTHTHADAPRMTEHQSSNAAFSAPASTCGRIPRLNSMRSAVDQCRQLSTEAQASSDRAAESGKRPNARCG